MSPGKININRYSLFIIDKGLWFDFTIVNPLFVLCHIKGKYVLTRNQKSVANDAFA